MTDGSLVLKRGDTIPAFRVVNMVDSSGNDLSFVSGDAGVITITSATGNTIVDRQPVALDLNANSLTYNWQAGDTNTAGEFRAEVEITFSDGKIGTWPNDGYYSLRITDDLPIDYSITATRVRNGFTTGASDADLAGFIAIVDGADECLTNNNVPFPVGQQLKVLAVRHMATNQRDAGAVTSERAVSGASRSYSNFKAGETGYLDTLRQLDSTGCVYGIVQQNAFVQLRSVGRRPQRQSTW